MPEADPPHDEPAAGRPPWYRRWQAWAIGGVALVVIAAGVAGGLAGTSGTNGTATGTGNGNGATAPTSASPPPGSGSALFVVLSTAWTAEQEAKATYDAVIAKFGEVQPFSAIAAAESRHIGVVGGLAARYGITLPSGDFPGEPAPATLTEACQVGVRAEQDVIDMYDELIPEVSGYPDLTRAFTALQAATVAHLAAFRLCA